MTLANPVFRDMIDLLSPDYLRYPGGTTSNSYYLITTVYRVDGPTIDTVIYYLEDPYEPQDSILDFDSDMKYYVHEEGSYLKNGEFLREDTFKFELNNPKQLLRQTAGLRSDSGGVNGPILKLDENYMNREKNYLKDFISLMDETGIKPVYVLRMFDPLLFKSVWRDGDPTDSTEVSPVLLNLMGLGYDQDDIACDSTLLNQVILEQATHGYKRQLIKYMYEHAKYFDGVSTSDSTEFDLFLNQIEDEPIDYTWNDFTTWIASDFPIARSQFMRFELGNEFYSERYRKFIPESHCFSEETNPDLYALMCSAALQLIDDVFTDAEVGVIGSHRDGHCDWTQRVDSVLEDEGVDNLFDAWIIHNYSRYVSEFVAHPDSLLNEANELRVKSPVGHLMGAFAGDYDSALDDKVLWITEFNVKEARMATNPIHGTWFDLIAKFNLLNQYIARQEKIQDSIPQGIHGLDDFYNVNSDVPILNMEMLLMHTIVAGRQGSVQVADDGVGGYFLDFTDQGLMAAIIDRLTRNEYKHACPIAFSTLPDLSSIPDSLMSSYTSEPNCGVDDFDSYSPSIWGWELRDSLNDPCGDYRYLLVNSSSDCVFINDFTDYDTTNVDLFMYQPDSLNILIMSAADIDLIQNPDSTFNLNPEGVCFHTGELPQGLASDEGIQMPPYSILIMRSNPIDSIYVNGLTVSSDTTLTGYLRFLDDVIVEDGADLTIDGARIEFADYKGIQVEIGGLLKTENGAVLTNLPCSDFYWKGIEVFGNPDTLQNPALQGKAVLDESEVSKAKIGISNYDRDTGIESTGGILITTNSLFLDCRTALKMKRYTNHLENGTATNDKSNFKYTDFIWTNDLPAVDAVNKHPLVQLGKVSGIAFKFCDFINDNEFIREDPIDRDHRPAIYSDYSNISLVGSNNDQDLARIEGFRYGLVQKFGLAYVDRYILKNYRSAYVKSSPSTFIRNEFGLLDADDFEDVGYLSGDFTYKTHYGLYLDYATDFWVEENMFDMDWDTSATEPSSLARTGLFVKDAGAASNMIYGNEFANCEYALVAYDNNRNSSVQNPVGLKIECNDFIDNEHGFDILTTSDTLREDWGIHRSQGVITVPPALGESAGNYFSGQADLDGRNADSLGVFTYNWKDADTPPSIDLDIDENNIIVPLLEGQANSCPTNVFETRGPSSLSISDEWQLTEQFKSEYFSLLNGGDTQFILNLIETANIDNYSEIAIQLLNFSPYLSEEVLISMIEHEDEIPNSSLFEILEANPHSSRSLTIQRKLSSKAVSLSEQELDDIRTMRTQFTYKDWLESKIGHHESRYCSEINRSIANLLADTIIDNPLESIKALVRDIEALEHRYWRIELTFAYGNIEESQRLLDSIPNQFSLLGTKGEEYNDFVAVYDILYSLSSEESIELNQGQLVSLEAIASKLATRAAGLAQIILNEYESYIYPEIIVEPRETDDTERLSLTTTRKSTVSQQLTVYPNPASKTIRIELPIEIKVGILEIYDMRGIQLVNRKMVGSFTDVNCEYWSEGVYLISLFVDDETIYREKIEIVK